MKLDRRKEGLIARKFIHYSAVLIPLIYYYFLDKSLAVKLLLLATFIVVFSDLLRMIGPRSRQLYVKLLGWMTKEKELKQEFTGASYMLVGSLVTVLLFPKEIAVIALILLTIGDPSACLVGTFLGKIRTFQNKTVEGTLGFILAGFMVSLLVAKVPVFYKLLAAIVGGVVEMLPLKIDDNFTVPLISGIVLGLLMGTFNVF